MNVALKTDLGNANNKIAWLESLIQHDEQTKMRALAEQRNHYMFIGGSEFRRALIKEELHQSKDNDEIAFLETHFMGAREGHGRYSNHHHPQIGADTGYVEHNPANDPYAASAYQAPTSQGMLYPQAWKYLSNLYSCHIAHTSTSINYSRPTEVAPGSL